MQDREASEEFQIQLLRRIATQDRDALAEFYDQFGAVLFATAVRILGDAQEAEEVMQDVFVQIWEKAATFDAALGTPMSWVLRIARNRAIDRLRARQRRFRALDELETSLAAESSPSSSARVGLSREEISVVRAAVQALPAEQRQAIELAFFGGQSHGTIAEALREPLGTIKARIRRGLLKLRDELEGRL